jgi:hypothetical protein
MKPASNQTSTRHEYPPIYEKIVPVALIIILVIVVLLIAIALSVVLGVFPVPS